MLKCRLPYYYYYYYYYNKFAKSIAKSLSNDLIFYWLTSKFHLDVSGVGAVGGLENINDLQSRQM